VEQCLASVKASVLLLYLMTNFTSSDTLGYLKALANRFPDKKIICGGPAFRDVTSVDTNIHLMKDFNKLINECKEIV
jgi:hypothetical protein